MPTKIQWTDESWNPISGCDPNDGNRSEGCKNCYARRMVQRLRGRYGYPKDDPFRVTFHPDRLEQPLKWKKPRRIFVCSMGDLFHKYVGIDFIKDIFQIIAGTKHIYLILTKRPERMESFCDYYINTQLVLPDNLWLRSWSGRLFSTTTSHN